MQDPARGVFHTQQPAPLPPAGLRLFTAFNRVSHVTCQFVAYNNLQNFLACNDFFL